MDFSEHGYIKEIKLEDTGGGCLVEYVYLNTGHVVAINDEAICIYRCEADIMEYEENKVKCIDLIGWPTI